MTPEDVNQFVTEVVNRINKAMKKDTEINGVIIADNAQQPSYTFTYKDGKLDIK